MIVVVMVIMIIVASVTMMKGPKGTGGGSTGQEECPAEVHQFSLDLLSARCRVCLFRCCRRSRGRASQAVHPPDHDTSVDM